MEIDVRCIWTSEYGTLEYELPKRAYQRGFYRRVLHLASDYGWGMPQRDAMLDWIYCFTERYVQSENLEFSTDNQYHTIVGYFSEAGISLADVLEEAIKDIPEEAVHTNEFNPDMDSEHIDSLYQKNMYYKVIYWSWYKPALKCFVSGLMDWKEHLIQERQDEEIAADLRARADQQ